jgi:phage repressor protein C with HTH and peptisase S24 domain
MAFLDNQKIGARLKSERERRKPDLSVRKYAIAAGIDASHYTKIEKGELPITEKILNKLSATYGLDKEYILYGKNAPHESDLNGNSVEEDRPGYMLHRRNLKNISSPFMVPLLPVAARAGYAQSYPDTQVFIQDLELYPILPGTDHRGAQWLYVEIKGDSMEPTLFEKDYILVSMVPRFEWVNVKPGKPYVILVAEEVLVKFIHKMPGDSKHWILASANKRIKQRKIAIADVKELWVFQGRQTKELTIPKIEISQ